MASWAERLAGVRGVLLDISGVLYDSGADGGTAIAGSVEAVARLKRSTLKVRFCTNESQKSRRELVGLLQRLGFDISEGEVTAPAPATCQLLKERGLRPHLLIHDGVRSEFGDIDMSNPNCVVIGDAGEGFSYQNMNRAFQVLMELENPVLISLGKGRYYKETSGLMLDVGCYMKALEYACGIEAEVVGKPSPEFFRSALQSIGLEAYQAIMIGDDIVGDVGGAQQCGMRALQVRTGKFRPGDEHHPEVKADGYVDNLAEAVELLLQHMDK
ncbi:phospholysine phosphohistidine inorganic pyrophosphate phosphatase [Psammomys obesus]|uniref:phospholysine phosphohistidine inorganic pyrophosphate phosphatase n=1 Tax=Psammomys obesus TaxID=48139 RepID=UPI0024532E37|nr:phospholysine phosphohistidine inorganic pyrophosphate phosphatase [Psammomys obesus]